MMPESKPWSEAEHALYAACLAASRGGEPVAHEQRRELLGLVRAVYDRSHSKKIKRLSKAGELTGALRLLRSEALYGDALLEDRLALLTYILGDSNQRPVAEQAALGLLELELAHDWEGLSAALKAVEAAILASPVKTLTAFGLANHLGLPAAATLRDGFSKLPVDQRRARMAELVGLLESYGGEPGISALVKATFESLFRGLDADGKGALVYTLFRDMEQRRGSREAPWHLLLDPLLAQNVSNAAIQARVLALLDAVSPERGEQYVLVHLRHTPPAAVELRVITFLGEHGSRRALPALHALMQLPETFFLFDEHAALRAAAKGAFDAIMVRERLSGLEAGALTLAEASGGELSLAASHGELSLADGVAVGDYPLLAAPARVGWVARLLAVFGLLWRRVTRR